MKVKLLKYYTWVIIGIKENIDTLFSSRLKDLDNYKFKDLISDISAGREIEFDFKNSEYSITNYVDKNGEAHWQFDNNTENKNIIICKLDEDHILIDFIKNLTIEGIALQDIFNNKMYTNLYVL